MKIAFFSDCYLDLTGGIVSSINTQKKELEKMGHEVCVFSTGYHRKKAELARLAKDKIFLVPSLKLFLRGITPISRRPKIVERWILKHHPEVKDFDIFYVHYEGGCSIAGLRLAKKLKIKSVQVMHGREDMGETNLIPFGLRTFVATALNLFHSWALPHPIKVKKDNYLADTVAKAKMWTLMVNHANYADLVITPSEHFRQKLLHYGVKKQIKVFRNPFPDEKFPADPSAKELKPGEKLKIIWHSRISAEKRMMPFLRALSMVEGGYHLDVFGGGGDYFRAKRFIRRHKIDATVYGNASFSRVFKKIEQAHLDVLVSYNFDTFGMTLIEAEAAGVPVLFCDPDMKEVVPDGGYVMCGSKEPEAIAAAISGLISHPESINKMSKIMLKNRHNILASKMMPELISIFKNLE